MRMNCSDQCEHRRVNQQDRAKSSAEVEAVNNGHREGL